MRRTPWAIVLAVGLVASACADDEPISESASPTPAEASGADTDVDDVDDVASETSDSVVIELDDPDDAATVGASGDDTGEHADHDRGDHEVDADALRAAYVGAAAFQDVAIAEAGGWVNTVETLGCFENPGVGGMGVHWLNEALLDDVVDAAQPEALVYELDADGEVAGLVGHEYLVPLDAWTDENPPSLFGIDFHPHPVLPFWILHVYLWKTNPDGMFNDWNPAIRMCPDGVVVFGEDATEDS